MFLNLYICMYLGVVSVSTLLVGYYHGLLLRDVNADTLTKKMCSAGLLNVHEQTAISSGHSIHHRNWLLLEHIRHMDKQSLLKFCKLLQEEWPEIGSQLNISTYVPTYLNIYLKCSQQIMANNSEL